LFSTIFLGNKDGVKKRLNNEKIFFKLWGISHYLARSGLHLVVFLALLELLLRLIPITFVLKQIISLCIAMIYFLLSWSSLSFMRAFLTFIMYKICLLLGLSSNFLHLVILTCFITLLYNPAHLFFLDFQLSFGLTFALAWFNHIQSIKTMSYQKLLNKKPNIT
jgi:competence protein ComEC